MDSKIEYVLILGSKPDYKIPNLFFKHIYAANGAIERVKKYETFFSRFELTSVLGGREFERNLEVKKRVLNSSWNVLNLIWLKLNLLALYNLISIISFFRPWNVTIYKRLTLVKCDKAYIWDLVDH